MSSSEPLILYVDDERGNRVVFKHSFGERFRLETASSAEEALEILKREEVGVLITDQRMPGMSGNDLLVRVKSERPEIVRIVLTAYSDLDPILRAVNEGLVARYVVKPWDRDELGSILSWASAVYASGREDSSIQLRLLETERLATLGSIVAAVIHDLRQPLTHLRTNVERVEQFGGDETLLAHLAASEHADVRELGEELTELAQDLQYGSRHLVKLLEQASSFIHRQSTSEPANVDPTDVISYAVSVCGAPVQLNGGRLIYDGPANLPRVTITFVELAQVLINLLNNAAQAITARPGRGGQVKLSATAAQTCVRFTVTDDGAGMDDETVAKVGTPFFSKREGGTGLGVLQVRRIVGRAGGSLDIHSTSGVGTTVTFTIPMA